MRTILLCFARNAHTYTIKIFSSFIIIDNFMSLDPFHVNVAS